MILSLAIGAAVTSVLLVVRAIYLWQDRGRAVELREYLSPRNARQELSKTRSKVSSNTLLNFVFKGSYKANIEKILLNIGSIDDQINEKFFKQKRIAIIVALFLVPFFLLTNPTFVFFAAIIFFTPDMLIYNKSLKHQQDVQISLPQTIDLLGLCVSAGLTFTTALSRVGVMQGGAMGAELSRLTREVRLGQTPAQAFMAMADRTGRSEINRLVTALNQVEKLGAPISLVLNEQGKEFREIRRAKSREDAQKVPIKILGPIMLCFLPALMIVVVAPAMIGILSSLGSF